MNKFKKEVEVLKKENQKLRKMLIKAGIGPEPDDEPRRNTLEELVESDSQYKPVLKKELCPNCLKELNNKEFGRFTYNWCDTCSFRKKINETPR